MSRSRPLWLAFAVAAVTASPAAGADSFSWESDSEGWEILGEGLSDVEFKSVSEGVPAAAVTDGQYAAVLTNEAFGSSANIFRGPGFTFDTETQEFKNVLLEELRSHTTIELDVYVPATSVLGYVWAGFYLVIEGPGMHYDYYTNILTAGEEAEGRSYHITWDYAADPRYIPDPSWGQISFRLEGGDTLGNSISPVYADNFYFSGEIELGLPGDFNGDGEVNAADYTVWRDNENAIEDGILLNGNGDGGFIDGSDYALWAASYGDVASSSALGVPEPGAVGLAAAGVLAITRRGRTRLTPRRS